MHSPERSQWGPGRIALWIFSTLFIVLLFGPRFIENFRPQPGRFMDFCQEWLSAKNYLSGTPVYANQTEALLRHTGLIPTRAEDMLPWNAHPPASVAMTIPFGFLDYPDAHLAWNILTLPTFLVSLLLVVRELGIPICLWSIFPTIVLLLLCAPLYSQLAEGQLNNPILLLMTLAWLADRREAQGWAGIALGFAAALKLYPAFAFAYFLFAGRWRAIPSGMLAFCTVNGLALALIGPNEFRTYIREVIPSLGEYRTAWHNTSLTGFWLRLFDPATQHKIAPLFSSPLLGRSLAIGAQGIVLVAVAVLSWRAKTLAARDRAYAASIVGMLLVSPVAWTHYFVLLALPVGLVWMRLPAGPWRWLMWLAFVPLWVPQTFFIATILGRAEAVAVVERTHRVFSPAIDLTVLSIFTYALVALFALVLRTPANGDECDDEKLQRRLLGSSKSASAETMAVEAAESGNKMTART
jgi:hypothetical protein